jgi:hypothetical protein
MKKIFLATMVLAGTIGMTSFTVQANAATAVFQDATETPVKPEELPEAVKTALSGDAYKDWSIASASHVKDANGEYYKVTLTKGQDKQEVKLNKDGQAVK